MGFVNLAGGWRQLPDAENLQSSPLPPQIISHAIWPYHRFTLSFRDIEDLLAERGIVVSYESIRRWCCKFGPSYARILRRRQGRLGDIWHDGSRRKGAVAHSWRGVRNRPGCRTLLTHRRMAMRTVETLPAGSLS